MIGKHQALYTLYNTNNKQWNNWKKSNTQYTNCMCVCVYFVCYRCPHLMTESY